MGTPTRRLLLVHAHPDDETISTGASMARYAAEGVGVTLVTCTLGEQGEILVPEYAQLDADHADQLGGLRIGELGGALRALGVTDHRWLGGAGRFRDSGMTGAPANAHPRAFWRAASEPDVFDEAVRAAVAIIREVRPQVVVTYDPDGDYGHPDHIMAHRVTTAAVAAAGEPGGAGEPWRVTRLYWTATPRSVLERGLAAMRAPDAPFDTADAPAFGVDDAVVTAVVDASTHVAAKRAALDAHRTQVLVHDGYFALSNRLGRVLDGVEHYRLAGGGPDGGRVQHDLFDGIPA